MKRILLLLPALSFAVPAFAEVHTLPITADVGICAHPREQTLNTGANSRIRIKGNEHYYLFRFETKPLESSICASAELRLTLARGNPRRVVLCTVPVAWKEGAGRNKPVKGAPCFTHRAYPDEPWGRHGGDFLSATLNNPHMLRETVNVKREGKRLKIAVPRRMVLACVLGLSHGLLLGEETGQTRENHDIFTREQSNARPVLVVDAQRVQLADMVKREPPEATPAPHAATFDGGGLEIPTRWDNPRRELPLATRVRLYGERRSQADRPVAEVVSFTQTPAVFGPLDPTRTYDAAIESWLGPNRYVARLAGLKPSPALKRPKAPRGDLLRLKNALPHVRRRPVWAVGKAESIPRPLTPRNAWCAWQVVVDAKQVDGLRVELGTLRRKDGGTLEGGFVYRAFAVPHKERWVPEVLVPVEPGKPTDAGWPETKAPPAPAVFVVEFFVPGDAEPGVYRGKLKLDFGDGSSAESPADIEVSPVRLSDEFHLAGDMNTYSSPARAMGVRTSDPDAFLAMERTYYRLAHAHRMTLNVLPYSQAGEVHWRSAPELDASRRRVKDWSKWDARYGPLLDGSAFAAERGYVGPGAGRSVRHMYLPFHENWPARLGKHFRPQSAWPPSTDYEAFLKWTAGLPPIYEYLPDAYEGVWQSVLKEFIEHLSAKKHLDTRFQVYLNNKHYFRRPRRNGRPGRGISLWLLDEPMHADDFQALAFFGKMVREQKRRVQADWARAVKPQVHEMRIHARNERGQIVDTRVRRTRMPPEAEKIPPMPKIDYRIDISRPNHQRTWLDGVVDLNVCADQLYAQHRQMARRRRVFSERYWNYRMPPSFGETNRRWAVWPVRSYCWGAVGTLVWQTIASDGDLFAADATALVYPGRKFGLERPLPSLRMKAWRAGLQAAELLRMLRRKRKWNHAQLRAWTGEVLDLTGRRRAADPDAADGVVTWQGAGDRDINILTLAVLVELAK